MSAKNTLNSLLDATIDDLNSHADEMILVEALMSRECRDQVERLQEWVKPEDFWNPTAGRAWEKAAELREAGKLVSKRNLLQDADDNLRRMLNAAAGQAPDPVYVDKAAEIVRDLRNKRLVTQLSYDIASFASRASTTQEVVAFATSALESLDLADGVDDNGPVAFVDAVEDWWEWVQTPPEEVRIFPTPWPDINEKLSGGLHSGRTYIVAGRPGAGKATSLDTPIFSRRHGWTDGWTTMGDLRVGDQVFDRNGEWCTITWCSQVQYDRPCYLVEFEGDFEPIVADERHEWLIEGYAGVESIRETFELARLLNSRREVKIRVPYAATQVGRAKLQDATGANVEAMTGTLRVARVTQTTSVPVRCIEVDSRDHMFLAGRSLIPTHNSLLASNAVQHIAEMGHPSLLYTVEMKTREVVSRLMASGAEVEYGHITRRDLTDHDANRLGLYSDNRVPDTKLWILDDPRLKIEQVFSIARQLKKKHGLDAVVLDYIQIMQATNSRDTRERQVAHLSRMSQIIAKTLDVAVIVAAQLNRNSIQDDVLPKLSDLRESDALGMDVDVALMLHHEKVDDMPMGEVQVVIAKNRTGPADCIIPLEWRPHFAKIGK